MNIEMIRQQRQIAKRVELWKEYVATYQRVMIETPEKFDQFQADFRQKYLAA